MAIARLDGIETYYEVHGAGLPVVLVAGYTCDHTFWNGILPHLARRFQVVVFDSRGIGRTKDNADPFSIDDMAADTAALIGHLGLSRPAVVGQSMGGLIVQAMLTAVPDSCGRCAILNSTHSFGAAAVALESLLALRKADIDPDLLADASLPWLSGDDWLAKPGNIAAFKEALKANPAPQSAADQERQLLALKSFKALLREGPWMFPTFVVSATEDKLAPPRDGEVLADSLDAMFVEIPGGHASPIEQPERLAQILAKFLRQ